MWTIIANLQYRKILILALLIRILVIPFYYHPDIKTYHFQSSFLKNGVWNIYSYLDSHKSELPLKEEFVYFPLTYFFLGGYQILIQPLLGDNFEKWLFDASVESSQTVEIFRYLFLLKLPYLIFDLLIAGLLTYFFEDDKKKKAVLSLWLFNPFTIILIYFYSNVDIIPVALVLLSLLSLKNNKYVLSAVLLGISAGFKAYPLLFLPFIILAGNNLRQRLILCIGTLLTFLLIILPFLNSSQFKQAALISGLTTRIFIPAINLGFNETLIIPIILIGVIFFLALSKGIFDINKIIIGLLIELLIIFSSIHFHIQWLLWIMPFVALIFIKFHEIRPLVIIALCLAFFIPLMYNDKSMTVSLLQVMSSHYTLLPIPFSIVQRFYDPYLIQSVLHSIFLAGSLIITWKLWKEV